LETTAGVWPTNSTTNHHRLVTVGKRDCRATRVRGRFRVFTGRGKHPSASRHEEKCSKQPSSHPVPYDGISYPAPRQIVGTIDRSSGSFVSSRNTRTNPSDPFGRVVKRRRFAADQLPSAEGPPRGSGLKYRSGPGGIGYRPRFALAANDR